jgi:hypothetical protein
MVGLESRTEVGNPLIRLQKHFFVDGLVILIVNPGVFVLKRQIDILGCAADECSEVIEDVGAELVQASWLAEASWSEWAEARNAWRCREELKTLE